MSVPVRWIKVAGAFLLVALVVQAALLWRPERQVELHTLNLLKRASARDWPAVAAMMAPDFKDGWGHDREQATDAARLVLSHFFALHIVALEPIRIEETNGPMSASVRIGIFGSGTGVAEAVMEEVRATEEPFVFLWRKHGRWPWQWVLVGAGNRRLEAYQPRF